MTDIRPSRGPADSRGLFGGGLMTAIGLGSAFYAQANYSLGTPNWPGAGMFPAALGAILAGLGAIIMIIAFRAPAADGPKQSIRESFDWRATLAVIVAILIFATTIRQIGLVPAIVLTTLAAKFADDRLPVLQALALGAFLAAVAWLVFVFWLGSPMPAFRLPR